MSTHTFHEKLERRLTYSPGSGTGVLVDECPRCDEQSHDPLATLDDDHIKALWREMVRVERYDGAYRSLADARVGQFFYRIAVFTERFGPGDPWTFFREEVPA